MRELFLSSNDSTESSLVLHTEDGEEFFLAVTDDIRSVFNAGQTEASAHNLSANPEGTPAATTQAEQDPEQDTERESSGEDVAAATQPAEDKQVSHLQVAGTESSQKPAPRMSDALPLRPAEIQSRIRAGASPEELAEEIGFPVSRLESFAHPVLLERARIAELAKQAHPVREDGPAKLTLWEILATAFAARGHSLSEAEWDAYRHKGEPWVVKIVWKAGLSENEAEWTFKQSMTSAATVEARNSVAADLTDPDFVQPVRSLTSLGRGARGSRYDEAIDGPRGLFAATDAEAEENATELDREYARGVDEDVAQRKAQEKSSNRDNADSEDITRDDIPQVTDQDLKSGGPRTSAKEQSTDGADGTEDFFQNPDPQPKPAKRRRKAVTPHWEDVLLGVRANTKRPRN